MAITGHVSPRMLAHYSRVRLGAKGSALDANHHDNTGGPRISGCVRAASHFHSPVEHAVEKQENAIFPFDKQKGVNRLHFGPTCSLEFLDCTKDRH
jgi:hypothetical protein